MCAILKRGTVWDENTQHISQLLIVEGGGIEFNGFTFANSPTVEHVMESNASCIMNGFSNPLLSSDQKTVEMQTVKESKKMGPVIDDNDYSVGYDYCGIPQYFDESNNQMQQSSFKYSIGDLNGHMI